MNKHDIKPDSSIETTEKSTSFRKSKRKKPSVFYVIYFSFIALFILTLTVGLVLLHGILEEYELSQPKYTAEDIFSEHFMTPDLSELIDTAGKTYTLFEPKDKVTDILAGHIKEPITYSETASPNKELKLYNVYSGKDRFASFSLKKSRETTAHGFRKYELDSITLHFTLSDKSYSFLIPEGYELFANGAKVGTSFISGEDVFSDAYRITQGKAGVKYTPYLVYGFIDEPTFTLTDREGNEVEITYDSDLEINTVKTNAIKITLPSNCTPFIEGVALTKDYLLEGLEESAYNSYLPENHDGIYYSSYAIEGFFDLPNVTVKAEDGTECIVTSDPDTFTYEAKPPYAPLLRFEHERRLLDIFEMYTLYIQYVKYSKKDIRPFFDTSSVTWKKISSISPSYMFEANAWTFTDESVDEYIQYSEHNFSCRVRLTYTGRRGSNTHTEVIDFTVFSMLTNDGYKIYNMTATEAIGGLGAPMN